VDYTVSPVLLGVRHHGPGSARAVRRALAAYRPDVVLIEGPPEADALVPLAGAESMRPPVALLGYPAATGAVKRSRAAFWPFAEFSPEWQALRWAVGQGVAVRFMDLPLAHRFGEEAAEVGTEEPSLVDETERFDPIGALAAAAGYDDPERWWEDVIEHRLPEDATDELAASLAPFAALGEAMAEVRAAAPERSEDAQERRREAYMRGVLRSALKSYGRVAVVCGAWHVPALTAPLPPASADASVLRGLPKSRVAMTWVPWTHGRLASWQGYGAGVRSPGWYHHLFTSPDRPVTRWLVAVAALLRTEGQPVSSAHVIEAVRLAETLAALRSRPLAGLTEVTEATHSVLCDGDDLRLHLVDRRMVVGELLGEVPEETPAVPLALDVAATQRRLRMQPSALVSELDLDLRKEYDLARSHLLHRLGLLGIGWGTPAGQRGTGTFHELWQLQWQPEYAVDLIEASAYGTTLPVAAAAKAVDLAAAASTLAEVTELVQVCLLADLPEASTAVLRALSERAALDADVARLMAAVPALARTLRYGDVRGTDTSAVRAVTHGLVVRICVGLPAAVASLDADAATAMRQRVDAVHAALGLLGEADLTDEWLATLTRLAERPDLAGVLAGRLTRLLLDAGRLGPHEAGRRMGLVLTVGVAPAAAAGWIEGFLAGGGLLLAHDPALLSLVDGWLAAIPPDTFVEVLPLLRRTFAEYTPPERRAIGERARQLTGTGEAPARSAADDLDPERAALVLPMLGLLLGRDARELVGAAAAGEGGADGGAA
jgi:hypothetical protein